MKSTVVIPTIGRLTLENAVHSAVREGMDAIVVCDGPVRVPEFPDGVKVVSLGKRFGCYGSMAYNVGAYLAKTEFIVSLADDDELGLGFGEILSKTLEEKPEIDIWIPQLNFNDGGKTPCCPQKGQLKSLNLIGRDDSEGGYGWVINKERLASVYKQISGGMSARMTPDVTPRTPLPPPPPTRKQGM